MIAVRRLFVVVLLGALAGCSHTLPDQDRRITVTPAIAKIPAEDLWKEYRADAKAADKKYWGRAIEVSGKVSTVLQGPFSVQELQSAVQKVAG